MCLFSIVKYYICQIIILILEKKRKKKNNIKTLKISIFSSINYKLKNDILTIFILYMFPFLRFTDKT